ncbi:DsrE family protein [Aquimarina sediminis]|uniref:DsrE family protein n=1 Tax=Aquimarina sediminis TaxID=2070536 RepID=UPI000C9FFEAF|nr:DsrE family protein [Aquimarina sediminis]
MKNILLSYTFILLPIFLFSQQKTKQGKIITQFGNTYTVANPDFKTNTEQSLKAVFDIGRTFKDSSKVNPLINTAARYLNMHTDAGVPFKKLQVALVIHGAASDDILNNTQYQAKYNIDNPNTPLLSILAEKGVKIVLCGQTAAHRNISKEDVHPKTQVALSAMTALVQLQNENYRLINF